MGCLGVGQIGDFTPLHCSVGPLRLTLVVYEVLLVQVPVVLGQNLHKMPRCLCSSHVFSFCFGNTLLHRTKDG